MCRAGLYPLHTLFKILYWVVCKNLMLVFILDMQYVVFGGALVTYNLLVPGQLSLLILQFCVNLQFKTNSLSKFVPD